MTAVLSRSRSAWITAVVTLAVLSTYEIMHPYGFFYDDSVHEWLPTYILNYDAVRHGTLAQINFYQYLGYALLADPQTGTFYFPIYLAMALAQWLGRPPVAIEWLCWVHLAAAALVVERYARLWKIDHFKSVIVAIFYITQPMVFNAPQLCPCVAYVVFYVPLVFLCLELLLREYSLVRLGWLALVKTLFLLSGHFNYFALSLIYEVAYVFLSPRFIAQAGRMGLFNGFRAWTMANALCGCWCMVSLAPVLMHLPQSQERSTPSTFTDALWLDSSLTDFLMDQIGNPPISVSRLTPYLFPGSWFFVGGAIFFIPLMLLYARQREMRFFFVLFLLGLFFCTPAFLILHCLPIYDSFRYPSKNFIYSALFYAMTVGLLLQVPTSRLFYKLRFAAAYLGIIGNIFTSFGFETSQVGVGHLFRRYGADFHLPIQQLQNGRSVLVTEDWWDRDPDFLGFLFATEAQVPAIQGYDPLISHQNYREALNVNYQACLPVPLSDKIVHHLRYWSVRYYFFDQTLPGLSYVEKSTLFRKIWQTGSVVIYEYLDPIPMAYFEDRPAEAVPYRFKDNSVYLSTQDHTGTLSISLIPLRGYSWRTGKDGPWHEVEARDAGRMTLALNVPSDQIELRYDEPYLGFFALFSVSTFFLWLLYCRLSPRLESTRDMT